jgi:hypothetical protein
MTLVEVMVAMLVLTTAMLGFLGSFIQSRRITESSVLHAAASSLVYGLLEQMKGLDYSSVPSGSPPEIRLRVTPTDIVSLRAVYTQAPNAPKAPATTPAFSVTAATLGAVDNIIGPLPLSSSSGTRSQQLRINLWVWIDEIPDAARDVKEVKKITVVYSYDFNDGNRVRTVRDREVILRTRFDQ